MNAPTFDEPLAEGASVLVDGWDYSWLEGRATEERQQVGAGSVHEGLATT